MLEGWVLAQDCFGKHPQDVLRKVVALLEEFALAAYHKVVLSKVGFQMRFGHPSRMETLYMFHLVLELYFLGIGEELDLVMGISKLVHLLGLTSEESEDNLLDLLSLEKEEDLVDLMAMVGAVFLDLRKELLPTSQNHHL